MHRIDRDQPAQSSLTIGEARAPGQALGADRGAQSDLAMQDDLGLAHGHEILFEHPRDGWTGQCSRGQADEPGLEMPGYLEGLHHPPDVVARCPHRAYDRRQLGNRAEHAVVGEENAIRVACAAEAQEMLPGTEIKPLVGPRVGGDALCVEELPIAVGQAIHPGQGDMHGHAATRQLRQVMQHGCRQLPVAREMGEQTDVMLRSGQAQDLFPISQDRRNAPTCCR